MLCSRPTSATWHTDGLGAGDLSGFSIAMGNASDAVKGQANVVTGSNENEGFAQAVRKFVLPQPGG